MRRSEAPAAAIEKESAAAVEEEPTAVVAKRRQKPGACGAQAATVLEVTVPELGDAAECGGGSGGRRGRYGRGGPGLVALESDKATVEVPAPQEEQVLELCPR